MIRPYDLLFRSNNQAPACEAKLVLIFSLHLQHCYSLRLHSCSCLLPLLSCSSDKNIEHILILIFCFIFLLLKKLIYINFWKPKGISALCNKTE